MEENIAANGMPERPGYWAIIPATIRYDDSIPPNAKLLFGEISALLGAEGFCWASNAYFAELYQMRVETISRQISKLEHAGYIRTELEKDASGKIVRRKIYINMAAADAKPLDKKINTPCEKNQGGIDKKVKEININNTKKENIKRKIAALDEEALKDKIYGFVADVGQSWNREAKNGVYFALLNFYAEREKQPSRSPVAVKTVCNRLRRLSGGNPAVMTEMLERSVQQGWTGVFPLAGDKAILQPPEEEVSRECL